MGSWITWTAGLIFFDIVLILLVMSFGQAGFDIGDSAYESNVTQFNSSQTIGWDSLNWFDKFTVSFGGMPWWINLFLVIFHIVLVGLLVAALLRGFS